MAASKRLAPQEPTAAFTSADAAAEVVLQHVLGAAAGQAFCYSLQCAYSASP